jgi:hypothetical protein
MSNIAIYDLAADYTIEANEAENTYGGIGVTGAVAIGIAATFTAGAVDGFLEEVNDSD